MEQDKKFSLSNIFVVGLFTLLVGVVGGSLLVSTYPDWGPKLGLKLPARKQTSTTVPGPTTRVVTDQESAVIKVVEDTSPAVVSIVAKEVGFDPETGVVEQEQGIGTGFITDASGVVLTNWHVVSEEKTDYTVVTKDKKSYPAVKIERDQANDIAIIKINASGLPTIKLGDSAKLKIGQTVVAIGNALGKFDNSVTTGVVSQIGRKVTASSGFFGSAVETLENVIQTDAALNPGNSGGPLINLDGEVIGINVATTQGAQNIGFAIPINTAKGVLEGYQQQGGRILKPFLGVTHQLIQGNARIPSGALIRSVVPNSPADKAGIKPKDVITKVDSKSIDLENPLASIVSKKKIGDSVEVDLWRDGQNLKVKATLEQAQSQ